MHTDLSILSRALPIGEDSIPEDGDTEEGMGGMSKRELLAALAAMKRQNAEIVRNLNQEKQSLTDKLTEAQEKSEQKLAEGKCICGNQIGIDQFNELINSLP